MITKWFMWPSKMVLISAEWLCQFPLGRNFYTGFTSYPNFVVEIGCDRFGAMSQDHLTRYCSLRRRCSSCCFVVPKSSCHVTELRQFQIRQDDLRNQCDRYEVLTEKYCHRLRVAEGRHHQFRQRVLHKLTNLEAKIDAMLATRVRKTKDPELRPDFGEIFKTSASARFCLDALQTEISYLQQELARQDRLIIAALGFIILLTAYLFRK